MITDLSRLADSPSGLEALYACIFLNLDKEPDAGRRTRERQSCSNAAIERIAAMRKEGDPLPDILAIERTDAATEYKRIKDPSLLVAAAKTGRVHAALIYLENSELKNDADKTNIEQIGQSVLRLDVSEGGDYIVSPELFSIIDNRPTQWQLVRANLLVALAHLTDRTAGTTSQKLTNAKRYAERASMLDEIERSERRQEADAAAAAGSCQRTHRRERRPRGGCSPRHRRGHARMGQSGLSTGVCEGRYRYECIRSSTEDWHRDETASGSAQHHELSSNG